MRTAMLTGLASKMDLRLTGIIKKMVGADIFDLNFIFPLPRDCVIIGRVS